MPRTTVVQTNFTAGEMSPRLIGRTDLAKYANGVREQQNFVSQVHGGAIRRSGTKHVANTKDSTVQSRLIPFQYNVDQTYMLEFGDQSIRFYRWDSVASAIGQVTSSLAVNATFSQSPGAFDLTGNQSSNVHIGDVVTNTGSDAGDFTVTAVTFEGSSPGNTLIDVAEDTGGGTSVTVDFPTEVRFTDNAGASPIPWLEADLPDVKFTQSADILYLCHPDYQPHKLQRTAGSDTLRGTWDMDPFDFFDGPYDEENTTATTLTPSQRGGNSTITASSAVFVSTDVGRVIRIGSDSTEDDAKWGWGTINTFNSSTEVEVTVTDNFYEAGVPTGRWRLGLFSDTTGWPWVPLFHQQRFWLGGHTDNSQVITASRIIVGVDAEEAGRFGPEDFRPSALDLNTGLRDSDSLKFIIADNRVNAIRWMKSHTQGLVIGTDSGNFALDSGTADRTITQTQIDIRRQDTRGSDDQVDSVQVDNAMLAVSASERELRELVYRFDDDQFVNPDMTLLAEHITIGGVSDMAYQQEPDSVVWIVRRDGVLLGFTYEREQQVVGWHRHILGGSFSTGDAVVESVGVIRVQKEDIVFLIVKRTINSATQRDIETIQTLFEEGDDIVDAEYLDSSLKYSGGSTNTVSGLDHLEGETVTGLLSTGGSLLANPVLTTTVSSGSAVFSSTFDKAIVGLPVTAKIKSLPLVAGNANIDPRSRRARPSRSVITFDNSQGGQFGADGGTLYDIDFPDSTTLHSVFQQIDGWPQSSDREPAVVVQTATPLPMTILSIVTELDVGDL